MRHRRQREPAEFENENEHEEPPEDADCAFIVLIPHYIPQLLAREHPGESSALPAHLVFVGTE